MWLNILMQPLSVKGKWCWRPPEPLHNLADLGTPVISGVLAEACRRTGRVEDAGVVLGEAFAVVGIADVYEMELHRLTGEVRLRQVPPEGTQVAVEPAAHHHRAGDEGRRGDLRPPLEGGVVYRQSPASRCVP